MSTSSGIKAVMLAVMCECLDDMTESNHDVIRGESSLSATISIWRCPFLKGRLTSYVVS